MSLEKGPVQKESSLPATIFQALRHLSFQGGYLPSMLQLMFIQQKPCRRLRHFCPARFSFSAGLRLSRQATWGRNAKKPWCQPCQPIGQQMFLGSPCRRRRMGRITLEVATKLGKLLHPPKTNMTLEKQSFEDVSPIKNGDFPMSC